MRVSIQLFYTWLCLLLLACLLIPPLYPAIFGGRVPLYAANFVFVAGALVYLRKSNLMSVMSDRVLKSGFAFLMVLALSLSFAWWHSGPMIASQALLRYCLVCQPFLVYWLVKSSPAFRDDTRLKSFAQFLFWVSVFAALYGIVEFYWPNPFPHPFAEQYIYLKGKIVRRAQGVFYESSSFGNLCAFFVSLSLCLTLSFRSRIPRRQQLALFVFGGIYVVALFLSYSRGSWLAVLVTLTIFLFLHPPTRLQDVFIAALLISVPILILTMVSPEIVSIFFNRRLGAIAEFSTNPNYATSGRWGSWSSLIKYFSDHSWLLLFGIGYKTLPYTPLFGRKIIADNGYLSMLFECGVVGLGTFLWLNLSLLRTFQKVRQLRDPIRNFAGTFMIAFWCGEMAQLFTGDIFTYWRNLVLFFAVAAAIQQAE